MMSEKHMLDLLSFYQTELIKLCNSVSYDYYHKSHGLEHCFTMINPMRAMVYEKQYDKFNRWLGFMQGIFWLLNIFSLEQLKNHNRSYEDFIKETSNV